MDTKRKKIILIVCSTIIVVVSVLFTIFMVLCPKEEHVAYLQIVGYLEKAEEQSETSVYTLYANFMDNEEAVSSTTIYDFNVDNNTLPDYIVGVKPVNIGMDAYELKSNKYMDIGERIDNIMYSFKLKPIILALIVLFIIIPLLFIVCSCVTDKMFLVVVGLLSLSCLIFQFWLSFPGQIFHADGIHILLQALNNRYDNWHPVIIALTYNTLFRLFGEHLFYIFLINLICWYVGIALLIYGLYLKYRNRLFILLFLLTFIQNFFLTNFWHQKDVTFSMYMWLACNIILFQILHKFNQKWINITLRIATGVVLFLALLWRHNAIVTIYPLFLYFTYISLARFNIKSRVKYLLIYCFAMLIIAMLLVGIIKTFPLFFMEEDNTKVASRHIELHRIAAVAVALDDESLIPGNWYAKGKTFEDLKSSFNDSRYDADKFVKHTHSLFRKEETVFDFNHTTNSRAIFIDTIKKEPYEFIRYSIDYTWKFWQVDQGWAYDSYGLMATRYYPPPFYDFLETQGWNSASTERMKNNYGSDNILDVLEAHGFPFNLELSGYKIRAISAIYKITPRFKMRVGIYASIILFFLSGYLWLFKKKTRNTLMLFVFATAFSAFATAIIVGMFSPIMDSRYLMPVLPIATISVVAFFVSKW